MTEYKTYEDVLSNQEKLQAVDADLRNLATERYRIKINEAAKRAVDPEQVKALDKSIEGLIALRKTIKVDEPEAQQVSPLPPGPRP